MKYCVPYAKHFNYLAEVDELIFQYGFAANEDLIHNLAVQEDKFKSKRIIIEVLNNTYFIDKNTLKGIIELKNRDFNIALKFLKYEEEFEDLFNTIKENKIDFFFGTWVRDWDTLRGLIDLGVSDIYIVENLGFELDLIGRLAVESGISIRVFANVCQTSWKKSDPIKSFFIRPEDVSLYDLYIDVIEFYGKETNIQNVMFRGYAKEKKWFGNLKEIIIGLDKDIDSRSLPPMFAARRVNCGKRCIKDGKCNICDRIIESEKVLKDKGFYFK